jgi:hypothetical protein
MPVESLRGKSEARNPKFETMTKIPITKFPKRFGHWDIWYLNIVSGFDIRISDLGDRVSEPFGILEIT